MNNVNHEKTIHPCQLPSSLIEKLIKVSTVEGDVVLVPFGGVGSEVVEAKRLGRRFVRLRLIRCFIS
ncbi:MAG: hypothetical protein HQK92_14290 [Nitrospirae bacterium]|nr:hypothetical protein [Nitrospirota bacterium]